MIGSIGFFDCFVMIEKLKTFTFEKAKVKMTVTSVL